MRVLVNALPIRHGGGASFLNQQMSALARVAPELELRLLVSPWTEFDALPGNIETVPVRSVATRFAFEQFRVPLRQADLLYCPANFSPLTFRGPIVLTLQNANYYRAGLALAETKTSRPIWKIKANHLAIRRADAVVAISHSCAADIVATLPAAKDKLHVIYSGAPEWPETSVAVEGLPDRYIVVVASDAPHKRVDDVVASWVRSIALRADAPALVLVGGLSPSQVTRYRAMAAEHESRLILLGQIRELAKLKWIYEHATAMVSMSVLESFGLTSVEAASVGCPLVLSDIPIHREVSSPRTQFVPPRDRTALAKTLVSVYGLSPGSRPWQWPMTWDENATQLYELFQSVAQRRREERSAKRR